MYEYGDNKGDAKPKSQCETVGPWWASFNEAACNVYDGIFCPTPSTCPVLKLCMNKAIQEAKVSGLVAFTEYLELAPTVVDEESTKECGALREYLGYDNDFPDDKHICEEFKYIQCRSDFSNLDETIANNSGDGGEEGGMRTKMIMKSYGES